MDVAYIGVLRTGVPTSCRTVLSFFLACFTWYQVISDTCDMFGLGVLGMGQIGDKTAPD
jgi:hypothetical protein